jgi:hypothetical protein
MKNFTFLMIFIFSINSIVQAQKNKTKVLKITNIIEYNDAYIIKGLDDNLDTLLILSLKEKIKNKCRYHKIQIGTEYIFELKEKPTYIDNLIIRGGNTIFWKTGDETRKMPYFANNLKDIYIKKDKYKCPSSTEKEK